MLKKWDKWEIEALIPTYKKMFPDYLNFIDWNNTILFKWEYELLIKIDAIDALGILSNYPILMVGDTYKDYDGDIQIIREAVDEIIRDGRVKTKPRIIYCPRSYSIWTEIKCQEANQFQKEQYAEEINTPPLSVREEQASEINW